MGDVENREPSGMSGSWQVRGGEGEGVMWICLLVTEIENPPWETGHRE